MKLASFSEAYRLFGRYASRNNMISKIPPPNVVAASSGYRKVQELYAIGLSLRKYRLLDVGTFSEDRDMDAEFTEFHSVTFFINSHPGFFVLAFSTHTSPFPPITMQLFGLTENIYPDFCAPYHKLIVRRIKNVQATSRPSLAAWPPADEG